MTLYDWLSLGAAFFAGWICGSLAVVWLQIFLRGAFQPVPRMSDRD